MLSILLHAELSGEVREVCDEWIGCGGAKYIILMERSKSEGRSYIGEEVELMTAT